MFLLKELAMGTRVINLDETWLSGTMYRRQHWRKRGTKSSIPNGAMNPRISVLLAIDTDGRYYVTMSHLNTDADSFTMFLSKLAGKLASEDRDWRSKSLIMYDGAK